MTLASVGDKGQRYEVKSKGYPEDGWNVIGWSGNIEGAVAMASSMLLAPGCTEVIIKDRQAA